MGTALRNRLIGFGFKAWVWSVRARRLLGALGRPRLRGVEHFTIPVKDLAVARRFYCDVLGGALFMTIDDAALKKFGRPPAPNGGEGSHHLSVYLGGTTRVDLFLQQVGQTAPTLGHPHYAFAVPPRDLPKWQRRLAAEGVSMDGPLQLGPPGQASIYFDDPSGNHLEITCLGFTGAVEQRPP
ncbi:MAG TPA: VOC family protein, partial [Reyranella sp.]|nr:VOC family protein [Reyranella sp.]